MLCSVACDVLNRNHPPATSQKLPNQRTPPCHGVSTNRLKRPVSRNRKFPDVVSDFGGRPRVVPLESYRAGDSPNQSGAIYRNFSVVSEGAIYIYTYI